MQTPVSIPPMSKRADRRHQVPSLGFGYFYTPPRTGSLFLTTAQERMKEQSSKVALKQEPKCLGFFPQRKKEGAASVHLRIANYQALLTYYDCINWHKMLNITDELPQE